MAVTQKKNRLLSIPGVSCEVVTVDVAAAANPTQAIVFARAFAAPPRVVGCVRTDNNALDISGFTSITALTALGCTIRIAGTTTVQWTFDVTFIGDYNNPTAY